ncbi:MAG: hypothetical protein ACLQSR_05505 [Limisphaerales bacterium]
MKLSPQIRTLSSNQAFTFTTIEMVMATTVFMMVIIALVATQIYGTRVYTLAATKLSATDGARDAMNKLRNAIQSANGPIDVGNYIWSYGSPTNFAVPAIGQNQVGNAIRIQAPALSAFSFTSPYTLIFLQPNNGGTNFATTDGNGHLINTNMLVMETFDTNYNPILTNILANYITNQIVFTATDYTGTNTITNYVDDRVIQITLFFSQWEYPIAIIGSNDINAYNYYRLQTRVTRRAINF